ncbi:hypothetical protein M0R45_019483 [Rubus argutus]|uniref:Uncharacterized protein n=1 Tax=Rubus argutus TaxID=59490 RepID=A0AAW1X921_RUBAR
MSLLGIIGGLGMQMLKKGLIVGLAILLYFNNGVGSDHCPLLIEEDPISDGGGGGGRRRRRFMFEEMWLRTVVELREELDKLQRLAPSVDNLRQRQEKEVLPEQVLEKEEIMCAQRSRVNWLHRGYRSTRFFHQYAKHRGQINKLPGILDEENKWHTGPDELIGVRDSVCSVLWRGGARCRGGQSSGAGLITRFRKPTASVISGDRRPVQAARFGGVGEENGDTGWKLGLSGDAVQQQSQVADRR